MTITITQTGNTPYTPRFTIWQDGRPIARCHSWLLANKAAGEITRERAKRKTGAVSVKVRDKILLSWGCELIPSDT